MKAVKFIFILIIFSTKLMAQEFHFGVIDDVDGYVNVRAEKNTKSQMIDKVNNGTIVYYFYEKEVDKNWITINYLKNEKEISGEVYINRIIPIENLPKLKLNKNNNNSCLFSNDTLQVTIKLEKFIPKNHKFIYDKTYKEVIEKIDGEKYYGSDGGIPKIQYNSIILKGKQFELNIPKKYLKNLFEVDLQGFEIYSDNKNKAIYIFTFGGDGAGAYASLVIIKNNKEVSRFVTIPF